MATITRIEPEVPAPVRRKRVAAYARVSKDTDGLRHSLSAQVSYYSSLIQQNPEWEYVGVFADLGITGTSTAKRKEFQRLMEECEKGNVDIILCKSISSFARNTVDTLASVRHLMELGVEVRFERENISTVEADGELLLTLLASFAEGESRSLSENIKWVVKKKYESGTPHTRKMMGYSWEGDELVVVPEQAEIVKRIYREYLDGKSYEAISRGLKADGIIGLRGKPLPSISVKAILKNEQYTGPMIFHKQFNYAHKKEKLNRGEVYIYRIDDHHEPIIDV